MSGEEARLVLQREMHCCKLLVWRKSEEAHTVRVRKKDQAVVSISKTLVTLTCEQ